MLGRGYLQGVSSLRGPERPLWSSVISPGQLHPDICTLVHAATLVPLLSLGTLVPRSLLPRAHHSHPLRADPSLGTISGGLGIHCDSQSSVLPHWVSRNVLLDLVGWLVESVSFFMFPAEYPYLHLCPAFTHSLYLYLYLSLSLPPSFSLSP